MKSKMHIYIPSYRRHKKQVTFQSVPDKLKPRTFIVVDKKDKVKYRRRWGVENVVVAPVHGIAATRQWIIDNSKDKYALMLDDDMKFDVRKGKKLKACSDRDFINMFHLLEKWLEQGFIHVGISQRFGNNRIEEDYKDVTRMNNAYAYNCKKMRKLKKKHGIAFDKLEKETDQRLVMEDFQITLDLLTRGYPNRVTYLYCWAQKQSGDAGGCSLYRTSAMQRESALLISKRFPGLARVVEKESKVQWKGFDSLIRTDLQIQWKKAFETSQNKSKNLSAFLKGK